MGKLVSGSARLPSQPSRERCPARCWGDYLSNAVSPMEIVQTLRPDVQIVQNNPLCIKASDWNLNLKHFDHSHNHTKYLLRFMDHPLAVERYALQSCSTNELVGLIKRHLVDQKPVSDEFVKFSRALYKSVWNELGRPIFTPLTFDELYSKKSTHVKKRFRTHRVKIEEHDVRKSDAFVRAFVKFERYDATDELKPPRMIQFRPPHFTARLSKFYTPIEDAMWAFKPKSNFGLRPFAKSRSMKQRAKDLFKMKLWPKTSFLLLDHSKYDSRITAMHLKLNHRFSQLFYVGEDRNLLAKLQAMTVNNRGRTMSGIEYFCKGRRMSGDADTGKGNSEINYTIIQFCLRDIPHAVYIDGDDSVISFPTEYCEHLKKVLDSRLAQTGMVSTYSIVHKFSDVEFCQSKPIFTNGSWMLARNPIRAISNLCYTLKPVATKNYITTIGVGEMHACSGVPLLYDVAKQMSEVGGQFDYNYLEYRHRVDWSVQPKPPNEEAYATMWLAWDLPPSSCVRAVVLQ